ncbi:MAG: tetratricopeptide repeat protein [Ignavibacteriaceae bacterium]
MTKYITLLIFLFAINLQTKGQDAKFDSIVVKGIRQIYSIEFEQADKTFNKLIADYPKHPAGKFFLAMLDWWRILLDTSIEQHDELFFKKIEEVIEHCDKILDEDPENIDAMFFKGGAIGFRGRLSALRESWLSAVDDGREALPLVEEAGELEPDNIDVKLGFGIYNYYASVIPEQYPIVKPLMIFLPSGDKELGLKQLKDVAQHGKYTKYEARYFLMTLYYRLEKDFDASEEYSKILSDDFPNNPVFERWRGRIAMKKGDVSLADSIFKSVLLKSKKMIPGYSTLRVKREANYYIGYNYRQSGKYDSAQVYLENCMNYSLKLDRDRESGFLINATLYLGMIKEMSEEYSAAKMYYEKVLDMREFGNSHSLAETYLERIEK